MVVYLGESVSQEIRLSPARAMVADFAAPLLEPGAERVVIFHLITEGACYVELDDAPPARLSAGDAVIFPQGDAHRMTSQPGLPPATGARLERVLAHRPRLLAYGGGAVTKLVCGYLACDARLAAMMLAGLPPLVRVNVRGSSAGVWLEASVRYALDEARSPRAGGAGVLAKLAEVLFIEVLRLYTRRHGAGRGRRADRPADGWGYRRIRRWGSQEVCIRGPPPKGLDHEFVRFGESGGFAPTFSEFSELLSGSEILGYTSAPPRGVGSFSSPIRAFAISRRYDDRLRGRGCPP